MKWHAMETAPKDGSKIRVRGLHGEDTARWHPNGCWVASWAPISFRDDSQPTAWREQTLIDDAKDREADRVARAKELMAMRNSPNFIRWIDREFDRCFGK